MREVSLVIEGQPYSKARPRVTSRGTYTPKPQKENAEKLRWEIRIACGARPFESNVAVRLEFYRSNRQRIDLDNLVKQVLDAANRQAWLDDSQVTAIVARLGYDKERPRTLIHVSEDPDSTMERGAAAEREATCGRCGTAFKYRPYPSQRPPQKCPAPCVRTINCAECDQPFEPPTRYQRFCCASCREKSKKRRLRAAHKALAEPMPRCRDCGVELKRRGAVLCRKHWLEGRGRRKADLLEEGRQINE